MTDFSQTLDSLLDTICPLPITWADDLRFLDLSKVDPSFITPKKNNKL
jgi:hypothetical protein